jgi:ferredoxin-NADP reductase/MOSC domain-containing protein YiiM/ferredoxin
VTGAVARLLSLNVGPPRDVPWQGRTVHTGAWKQPVTGPVMLRRLNLDGDGQGDLAGHGGEQRAVLVYQAESYRYWQHFLDRDDLGYGGFGENFTVDGLSDDDVRIGDRYRVGAAVVEVTQPRVTCYRVGMRLGEPRMAALMVQHRRPGFYLRVLTEGYVWAGDELVRIAQGPEPMTVAQIDGLLYRPGRDRTALATALRIPALSPGWHQSMQALLDQRDDRTGNAGLVATGPAPAWAGFRPLTVTAVRDESRDVFSLELAAPDGAVLPDARPGQFLTVRLVPEGGAAPIIRSYSLSGAVGIGTYRISVKAEPHGAGSGFLRTHAKAGATIDIAAPRGTFLLGDDRDPVLLLSAGIGATPVLAMLHALAAARSDREIWWVHGARDATSHPFAAETRALLGELPHAHAYIAYSSPGPDDRGYDATGRIDRDVLAGLGLPPATGAYLCGPAAFMADMTQVLAGLGFAADRIHTELFGAASGSTPGVVGAVVRPPHPPQGTPGTGPAVSFARSGVSVPWSDAYPSLLDLAEACDVPVRWSCRTGVCHTCESGLLAGTVGYEPDPIDPPGDGNLLICCSRPSTPVVLDL